MKFLRRLPRVNPLLAGSSNRGAPVDAQANYRFFEAAEERFLANVRSAGEGEFRSPLWRVIDPGHLRSNA